MDGRKWEDLDFDCLVNILGRVGIETLLLDAPFVCKSWYKATLDPQCWKKLVFPGMSYYDVPPWSDNGNLYWRLYTEFRLKNYISFTTVVKSVVNRSNGSATFLELPSCCTEEALEILINKCPDLRTLLLPKDFNGKLMLSIQSLLSKWEKLESLRLYDGSFLMEEILSQISIHCKNFVSLAFPTALIRKQEASAIVTFLPSIKHLTLTDAYMRKENLVIILQGCRELEFLDVRGCVGFNEDDEEILKLASHIRTVKLEGSSSRFSFNDSDWPC